MAHTDRRNIIHSQNEIFSDQSIEEGNQIRYKTNAQSNYKNSKGLRPTFHNDVHEGMIPTENQQFKVYNREAKEKISKRSETIRANLYHIKITISHVENPMRISKDTLFNSRFCTRKTKRTIRTESLTLRIV